MYDRKAEKAFRPLLENWVKWLESAECEEYDEEEGEEQVEETKAAPLKKVETEADRVQRELIDEQQKRIESML